MTLSLVALVAAAIALPSATFRDTAGDSGGAPDITVVEASAEAGAVTFRVSIANMATLAEDAELFLAIDSNASAGDQHGVDFVYSLRGRDASLRTRRWDGSQHVPFNSTARGSFAEGTATFVVDASELGSPATVRFGLVGVRGNDSDAAPGTGVWTFRLTTDTPRVMRVTARFRPALPRAGALFRVTSATATRADGTTSVVRPRCTATLAARRLAGGCSWRIPAGARGRTLTVRVSVPVEPAVTRTYRFRVR